MERRGRIPVAKFRTLEGKTRSRSRVREPDYNEQDPETDLFTLIEDNIALKEENKTLRRELEECKKKEAVVLDDNMKMCDELSALKVRQQTLEDELKNMSVKQMKSQHERSALEKTCKSKELKINALTMELKALQEKQMKQISAVAVDSVALKSKLLKTLPSLNSTEMESFFDVETSIALPINGVLVERLVDEFLILKNSMNSVELQLYEANEKTSELLESQHHLEEENEALREENANLTRVAKLLTENMKESVDTSKKMEAALIKLKQRNDELTTTTLTKTKDFIDGPATKDGQSPLSSSSSVKEDGGGDDDDDFQLLQAELQNPDRENSERIVEMRPAMDAAIENVNTNDELKSLQLKLAIVEEDLRKTIARAELAESELAKYRGLRVVTKMTPPVAPPVPPPLPHLLATKPPVVIKMRTRPVRELAATKKTTEEKIIGTVKQQVHVEAATGLDALVREFKLGGVTLRRSRRKTQTNKALQEMFQVLELSQKRNRDSKVCIDMNAPSGQPLSPHIVQSSNI